MTDGALLLLCFDGGEDRRRPIRGAATLLGPRRAVVLTVWESARELTRLDPLGDAVGRLSGLYAELDGVGMDVARGVAAEGVVLAQ